MKKISLKILGVLTIIIIFAQLNVFAASKSELKENSSNTDKKIEEAKEELEGIQAEKSETLKQVENLMSEISSYQNEIDQLDNQISKLNNDIKDAENKLNQKQEDYKKEKELLEKRLVATYEAGETSYLDVLLSSKSLTDLISNYYLVTELTRNDKELMEKIKKEEEEIAKVKTTLENSKSELNNSKVAKQSKATQLKQAKSQKDSYISTSTRIICNIII